MYVRTYYITMGGRGVCRVGCPGQIGPGTPSELRKARARVWRCYPQIAAGQRGRAAGRPARACVAVSQEMTRMAAAVLRNRRCQKGHDTRPRTPTRRAALETGRLAGCLFLGQPWLFPCLVIHSCKAKRTHLLAKIHASLCASMYYCIYNVFMRETHTAASTQSPIREHFAVIIKIVPLLAKEKDSKCSSQPIFCGLVSSVCIGKHMLEARHSYYHPCHAVAVNCPAP
jgi:hypothetical protein